MYVQRIPFSCAWLLLVHVAVPAEPLKLTALKTQAGTFEKIEFNVAGLPQYNDPFDPATVDLRLEIAGPEGAHVVVPAFYCQNFERRRPGSDGLQRDWSYPVGVAEWKARFAASAPGSYTARAVLRDAKGQRSSAALRIECLPSAAKGFVRVSVADPRFLEFDNHTPFFPIGQNLAFIGSQQYVTVSRAEEIFSKLSANGANYLRVWTCADDWAIAVEARKSAWGRSWDGKGGLVPDPQNQARKCLRLTPDRPAQEVNPSHPVALRPNTKYSFRAKVSAETNALVRATVHAAKASLDGRTPGVVAAKRSDSVIWNGELQCEFVTGARDYWLGQTRLAVEGQGTAWITDISLQEAGGGPELLWEADMNRQSRGYYNPLDCFLVDEIVAAAEQRGIYLQLCMLTRDLYMSAMTNETNAAYDRAIADASKFFRYAIARWGYSTSVAAWEYWNEMNPGLPTDRFYAALGEFFEQDDPYHHLRTTSTWGPSAKDCRHPKLDMADVHFYLRPVDKGRLANEVDAVLERTRWIREQAPRKPAHLGEFGLADDKWRITDPMKQISDISDVHNALWASALSGATGTAMFWWWERIDQRNGYAEYRPLSRFLADVPWNSGEIAPIGGKCSDSAVRVIGVRAGASGWAWLFDPAAAWEKVALEKKVPGERRDLVIEIPGMTRRSRVIWSDTRTSDIVGEQRVLPDGDILKLRVPPFRRDLAFRIQDDQAGAAARGSTK